MIVSLPFDYKAFIKKNFAESALVIKYYKQETLFIWRQGERLLSLGLLIIKYFKFLIFNNLSFIVLVCC